MKKIIPILIIMTLFACLCCACGKSDIQPLPTQTPNAVQSNASPSPTAEPTVTPQQNEKTTPLQTEMPVALQTETKKEPEEQSLTCTISITCKMALLNSDKLNPTLKDMLPQNGVILAPTKVAFTDGESVYDVLLRVVRENNIHMESTTTPAYNARYIEGIANLYEFDCGELSGWMYTVNGSFPGYGCSKFSVSANDVIEWMYTCDLGRDIGGEGVTQQ